MAKLAKTYRYNEFGQAADYARYLAKKGNREMRIYFHAYTIGGYYIITTDNHEPLDRETLIATLHQL